MIDHPPIAALIERLDAAGYRLHLQPGGGVRIVPRPPADLAALLRAHRDEIAAELRRRAGADTPPVPVPVRVPATSPEAAGELAACAREGELLRRVSIGLGEELDATLWAVLDRVLDARDLALADALWAHVLAADRRGIYSRLVGWLRSLHTAGEDLARIRALVESGPGRHHYHDAHVP